MCDDVLQACMCVYILSNATFNQLLAHFFKIIYVCKCIMLNEHGGMCVLV